MSVRAKVAGLTGALLIAATSASGVLASSHREAPLISGDPGADNTDLYAFVTPNATDTLTIIANFTPFEEPSGGPNYFPFGNDVRYNIKVDNDGDGVSEVTFQFRFSNHVKANNAFGIPTYLYNDGQITSPGDANWLTRQTYKVYKNGELISGSINAAPANVGPRSTPSYKDNLGTDAVAALSNGMRVYAGQRDDPFFADIGSIFDLGGLRPFNPAHLLPMDAEAGVDGLSGFNTNTIAIRVPIRLLTADRKLPSDANDPDAVVGIWATADRQATRTINADGSISASGSWRQVSRLGNPLINEVIIPRVKKDYWNSQRPVNDSQFLKYYRTPELAALVNYLYPGLPDARTSGRDDLAAILLTGLDLRDVGGPINLNKTGSKMSDMLRVNTAIKPNAAGACVFGVDGGGSPSRLGVLEADLCGFPNGRRLLDDVVDIELRAVADGYGPVVNSFYGSLTPNLAPNNTIGDGVDENDKSFLTVFPFASTPHQGYDHDHLHGMGGM